MAKIIHDVKQRRLKVLGRGTFTHREWREKCALLGNVCFYCGEATKLTQDHKVPISRGGTNLIGNIVPACLACNVRKGTQTAEEFMRLACPECHSPKVEIVQRIAVA